MVWLLGHRQPKGAVNGDARPTATAPHLDSTVRRRPGLRRQRRQHLSELTFRPQRQQGAASPTFLAKRSLALDGHKRPVASRFQIALRHAPEGRVSGDESEQLVGSTRPQAAVHSCAPKRSARTIARHQNAAILGRQSLGVPCSTFGTDGPSMGMSRHVCRQPPGKLLRCSRSPCAADALRRHRHEAGCSPTWMMRAGSRSRVSRPLDARFEGLPHLFGCPETPKRHVTCWRRRASP